MVQVNKLINEINGLWENLMGSKPKPIIYMPVAPYNERRPTFQEMWFRKPNNKHNPVYIPSTLHNKLEKEGPFAYDYDGIYHISLTKKQYDKIQLLVEKNRNDTIY